MSCALQSIANLTDLKELFEWFCLIKDETDEIDWESDWGVWNEEKQAEASVKSVSSCNPNWLNDCTIAVSPALDLLAFSYKDRIAFFTSTWNKDDEDEKVNFSLFWKSSVAHNDRDFVTSLLCLPIASQKQSSSGAPDWSCVIVGFQSGFVSIYTINGLLLFAQPFEETPVLQISCRTFTKKILLYGSCADLSEELLILYENAVVTIDGFCLLQMLKSCRNEAAKAAASGEELPNFPPPSYKKWSLSEQEKISDCVSAGLFPPLVYDNLLFLSASKGFQQTASSGVPSVSQLLTTGIAPFVGILAVRDIVYQPFVTDIALHYASKLKSAFFSAATGWLSRDQHQKDANKSKVKIEAAQAISFRYSLPDRRRMGLSIKMCSARRMAAITDDFGRISLYDIHKACVVRIWKGYRDAECGWMDVEGDYEGKKRIVSYFIIHAPRRGILEVWLPQQGPRIAAFNIPKGAKLLYIPQTLLGSNTLRSIHCPLLSLVLIYPNGALETVNIPFHLALSGKTSHQARDLHLLKTLKTYLKEEPEKNSLELIREINTWAVKIQLIHLIKSFRYLTPSLTQGIIDIFLAQISEKESCLDHDFQVFYLNIYHLKQLLNFYNTLSALHLKTNSDLSKEDACKKLSRYLMLPLDEVKVLFSSLQPKITKTESKKTVSFAEEDAILICNFLSCWEITDGTKFKRDGVVPLSLVKCIHNENKQKLGILLFDWSYSMENIEIFLDALVSSGIHIAEILDLLLSYWLEKNDLTYSSSLHFYTIILIISVMSQVNASEECNPFWEKVRAELFRWKNPQHTHFTAIVCRGVEGAIFVRHQDEMEVSSDCYAPIIFLKDMLNHLYNTDSYVSFDEWEGLSHEMVEWNLILKKLEQLLPVQKLQNLFSSKGDAVEEELSLKMFTEKGKGYLTEVIAKWVIESGVDLKFLSAITQTSPNNIQIKNDHIPDEPEADYEINIPWEKDLKESFESVSLYFKHSLEKDVLFVNISWEYAVKWNKNTNDLSSLQLLLQAVETISNPYYKHGLCLMVWDTWLVNRVKQTAQLMEKFGQIPKERTCLKDIGISEASLSTFFNISRQILERIGETNVLCEVARPPTKETDLFWRQTDHNPPLADLCVVQKMSSYDLVVLHHQFLTTLYLISTFSLKNARPISLFTERERIPLFQPLSTAWSFGAADIREVINSTQLSFLCRCVSAFVIALPDLPEERQIRLGIPEEIREIVELGRSWGVSVDAIRRHYICSLYNGGLDAMTEKAFPMIRDVLVMGSQMIVIAGQRLQYMASRSPLGAARILALTSPYITDWIKDLETKALRCPDVPIEKTITMVGKALKYLPPSSAEYKTAERLLDTLLAIRDSLNS